ncbi:unnamed protein product [Clonostachys rhizophaga]|uniref:Uncharacterized protein n=1 Tax=Clonostachys rhizophaga TaxID=160324 RepID=A0A9N9VBB3_9HYPO|nr:unnamed protein product [Clonostachys rhizophaga]
MSNWAATIAIRARLEGEVVPPCQLQTAGRADEKSEWGKDRICPAAHVARGETHDYGLAEWYFVTTWGDPKMRSLRGWAHPKAKGYLVLEPRHLRWEEYRESIRTARGGKFREDLVMRIPNYDRPVPVGTSIDWERGMADLVIHHTDSEQSWCRARTPLVVVCTRAEYKILVQHGWEAVEKRYKKESARRRPAELEEVAMADMAAEVEVTETQQELSKEMDVDEVAYPPDEAGMPDPLAEMDVDEAVWLPDEVGMLPDVDMTDDEAVCPPGEAEMLPDVDMTDGPEQVPPEGTTDEIAGRPGDPVVVAKDEGQAWRINIALRVEEGCSQTDLAVDIQVGCEGVTPGRY